MNRRHRHGAAMYGVAAWRVPRRTRRWVTWCIPLLLMAALPAHAQQAVPDWLALHRSAVVVDGHSDYPTALMRPEAGATHLDVGRRILRDLRTGGVDVQLWAIWVSEERVARGDGPATAQTEALRVRELMEKHGSEAAIVTAAADIAPEAGRHSAILAVEGAAGIAETPAQVRALHAAGVRCIGLTWNNSNALATSARDEASRSGRKRRAGLTPAGRRIVALCDSLGIIIDISHCGPTAVRELLTASTRPRIASHTGCTAIRNIWRNLTDEQLRGMARTGGVAMVTFVPGFISGGGPVRAGATAASCERRLVPLRARFAAGDYSMLHEWDSLVTAAGADGLATIADVVATIDHVVKVAGVDHVGIGSDFGAIDALPVGLASAADFPFITYLLVRRGYSAEDVRKILGGNFMRVFRSLNR